MARTTPEPDPQDQEREAPADDGVKRRFREALDRKNARHHASAASGESGESKVHSAHGPASQQRTFRRKSGG